MLFVVVWGVYALRSLCGQRQSDATIHSGENIIRRPACTYCTSIDIFILSMVQSSPSCSDISSCPCTPPLLPSSSSKSRRHPVPRSMGVDPSLLVGKVLTRLSRSLKHPTLTLDFADNTTFQILVDGYDPVHRCVLSYAHRNSK